MNRGACLPVSRVVLVGRPSIWPYGQRVSTALLVATMGLGVVHYLCSGELALSLTWLAEGVQSKLGSTYLAPASGLVEVSPRLVVPALGVVTLVTGSLGHSALS
jgi:hypothetical protein